MARSRIKSAAGWVGVGLLYVVGFAAIGISERASKANEAVPWLAITGVMLAAFVACGLLLWACKSDDHSA